MRHLVYRSHNAKVHLCVVDARDRRHALKIARRMFRLDKTAFALREDGVVEKGAYTPTSGYAFLAAGARLSCEGPVPKWIYPESHPSHTLAQARKDPACPATT